MCFKEIYSWKWAENVHSNSVRDQNQIKSKTCYSMQFYPHFVQGSQVVCHSQWVAKPNNCTQQYIIWVVIHKQANCAHTKNNNTSECCQANLTLLQLHSANMKQNNRLLQGSDLYAKLKKKRKKGMANCEVLISITKLPDQTWRKISCNQLLLQLFKKKKKKGL